MAALEEYEVEYTTCEGKKFMKRVACDPGKRIKEIRERFEEITSEALDILNIKFIHKIDFVF
jgi:hypothetical protein